MEKNKILIYGAAGYMGQLLLKLNQKTDNEIVLGSKNNLLLIILFVYFHWIMNRILLRI